MFTHSLANGRTSSGSFDRIGLKLMKDEDHRGRIRMGLEVSLDGQNQPKLDNQVAREVFLMQMQQNFPDINVQVIKAHHLRKGWGIYFLDTWLGRHYAVDKALAELTLKDLREPLEVYADAGMSTLTVQSDELTNGAVDAQVLAQAIQERLVTHGKLGIVAMPVYSEWRPGRQWTTIRLQPEGHPELRME
jgi:hypothetical protein